MCQTRDFIWGLLLIGCAAALQANIDPKYRVGFRGETVFFRCIVVGEAKEIAWYDRVGKLIAPDDPDLYVIRDGQTSELVIQRIALDDTGVYRCMARNGVEVAEATVMFEVYQKIMFQDAPSPQTFKEDEDADVICNVDSTPQPEVVWKRDGARINYDNQSRFQKLSNNHLKIRSFKKTDEGIYTCEARIHILGEIAFKQIEVGVNEEVKDPKTKVDEQVTMTCVAPQDPTRTCTACNFGNKRFPVAAQSGATLTSLVLKNLHFTNAGQYLCTPTNPGAKDGGNIHLAFEYAPKFLGEATVYAWKGKATNISCEVDASPAAVVIWSRDGVPLWNIKKSSTKFHNKPNASYLTVIPDSQEDFGNYTCEATNALGTRSWDILLQEAELPSPPQIQLVEPFSDSAVVVFTAPESSGVLPITEYKVQCRSADDGTWLSIVHSAQENLTRITIRDLRPEISYEVKMSAVNDHGASKWSAPVTFKIKN